MTTIQKVLGAIMALMIGTSTNAQSAPPIVDATIVLRFRNMPTGGPAQTRIPGPSEAPPLRRIEIQ